MKLQNLIEGVPVLAAQGDLGIEINGVTADSRQAQAGSLFVAVPGFIHDGVRFVDGAIERGAAAIVAEAPPFGEAAFVRTDDARTALAVIASNFYGHPAGKFKLIGVTGTSGKTTTTKMIESVLDATGDPVGMIGTIEYRAGQERITADRTTPDAVVLQEWLARMAAADVRYAVMEVSSHALVLRRTWGVRFAAAVFTNLSRDHFDFHHSFEEYFAAKRMLFDQIDRTAKTAVVNIDDPYGRRLAADLGDAVISFGISDAADIRPAGQFRNDIDGLNGVVRTPWGDCQVNSALVGTPNLYNWLGAIGACGAAGIGVEAMERGIRDLKTVRGRFERVGNGDATVLVDYAHKPDALEKLLGAVRGLSGERRIVLVFGCGGDRDAGKRPLMGEIAGRLADLTILTSDNPRGEDPERILDEVEKGLSAVPAARYERIADRRAAIERAMVEAEAQSVVVIAGKGHENYQVIGDQIIHFDDREEAEFALQKLSTKTTDTIRNDSATRTRTESMAKKS
ncbi:MAG: UDP-N-acetylmuramoyl-L-alanyl-D-glutamate--2,6-diaminopimelate ligase [Acidobacteriota bacterium]